MGVEHGAGVGVGVGISVKAGVKSGADGELGAEVAREVEEGVGVGVAGPALADGVGLVYAPPSVPHAPMLNTRGTKAATRATDTRAALIMLSLRLRDDPAGILLQVRYHFDASVLTAGQPKIPRATLTFREPFRLQRRH